MTLDGEASAEHPEPLGTAEAAEVSATVETQSKTKDTEDQAEADGVIENGIETNEEGDKDEDYMIERTAGEPAGAEVCSKEITVESSAQNPEETQESV